MLMLEPRSTSSHCGSVAALAQRVPVLPSKAADAGVPAFSVEEVVAVLLRATLVVPQPVVEGGAVAVEGCAVGVGVEGGGVGPKLPKTWNSHSE
jgi:hypothetical protein